MKQRIEIYKKDTQRYKNILNLMQKKLFPEKLVFDRIYFLKNKMQITIQELYIEVIIPKELGFLLFQDIS